MSVAGHKKELRTVMRSRLAKTFSEGESDHGIPAWMEHWPGTVLLFCATGGERPTRSGAEYFLSRCIPVALPRVDGKDLVFHLIPRCTHPQAAFDQLEAGFKGIPEPPACWEKVSLLDSTQGPRVVCVPGLAFDHNGRRLGRGGGYYDRLLAELAPAQDSLIIAGWCWPWQIVDEVPTEAHDLGVDCLLTGSACIFKDRSSQKKCITLAGG